MIWYLIGALIVIVPVFFVGSLLSLIWQCIYEYCDDPCSDIG